MKQLISLSLLTLIALGLLPAGGRSDEHRDTRRTRPSVTPTVTLTTTSTPAPLNHASEATSTPIPTDPLACYIAVLVPETDTWHCALWLPTEEFPPPPYPGP